MALTDKLTAIGDAIRTKTGSTDLLTLDAMPTAISGIETGSGEGGSLYDYIPEEALTITGDCKYRFANGGWDWFIENYGDKIVTKDLTDISYMFSNSKELEKIDFSINGKDNTNVDCTGMFQYCTELKSIPKLKFKVKQMDNIFSHCETLRELALDSVSGMDFNTTTMDNCTSAYNGSRKASFDNCMSLRSFPIEFLNHGNPICTYNYSIYNTLFNYCYVLDEAIGLPFPHYNAVWTANAFTSTFTKCRRLKNVTFALQEDGTPYTMQWKTQTIDLSKDVGHYIYSSNPCDKWMESQINSASKSSEITIHNSGITTDKAIYTAETYALLKDDPDSYCLNSSQDGGARYSRYNHDSAVATINSLPDTSAYLATAGGTNTIKFLGASGSPTDGGAISTLTEEEIAVATAKGWTVTLV